MSVKISELPILDSLADNDVIAGVDTSANVTSKIEMATLKNYIDTNTQYTAGTNIDITNNVVSAPNVYNKDEMDNQIEELKSEVDSLSTIFNAFPTESGEGESVTLDDTAEVKFKKFDLKGNTSQETTTGKNLAPINWATDFVTACNTPSIVYTTTKDNRNCLRYNPSAGYGDYDNKNFTLGLIFKENTQYTISYDILKEDSDNKTVAIYYTDNTYTTSANVSSINTWEHQTITSTAEKTIKYIAPFYTNGKSYIDLNTWQIEEGTSATDYEKPTNGASPNPQYPQDVHVVSGDNTINVESKNLLDEKGLLNSTFITGVYKYTKANFKGNRTLYFKAQLKSGKTALSGLYIALANYGSNPNAGTSAFSIRNGAVQNSGISNDFTGTEDLYISFYPTSYTWGEINNTYDLWVSTSNTTYSEYQGQVEYQINLGVENLFDKNYFTTKAESWPAYENQGGAFKLIPFYVGTGTSVTFSSNVPVASSSTIYAVDELGRTQGTTNNINVNTTRTIVGGTNGYVYLGFVTNRNYYNDLLNGTYWVQIEEGTKANSYTPYGQMPIEMCSIGNYSDTFVKTTGKNLLNFKDFLDYSNVTYTDNGYTYFITNVGSIVSNRYPLLLKDNTTYTLSCISISNVTSDVRVQLYKNGAYLGRILASGGSEKTYTFTTGANETYTLNMTYSGTLSTPINVCGVMLNEDSSALPYQPYGTNEWYLEKNIGKVVLDGSESGWANMFLNNQGLGTITVDLDNPVYQSNDSGKCNYFIYKWVYNNPTPCFYVYNNGNIGRIMFITNLQTKTEFMAWLSTHNTIVYYVLATPTYTKIEGTLIDQLNELEKAMSKDGQTNISQVSNDKPFILDVTAIKSLQSVLDRIELLES